MKQHTTKSLVTGNCLSVSFCTGRWLKQPFECWNLSNHHGFTLAVSLQMIYAAGFNKDLLNYASQSTRHSLSVSVCMKFVSLFIPSREITKQNPQKVWRALTNCTHYDLVPGYCLLAIKIKKRRHIRHNLQYEVKLINIIWDYSRK